MVCGGVKDTPCAFPNAGPLLKRDPEAGERGSPRVRIPGGAVVAPCPTSIWSRPTHRDACATSVPQTRGAASPPRGGGGGRGRDGAGDGCCGCQATCTGGTPARARVHETALPGPAGNVPAASRRGQTQRDRQTDPVTGDAATGPHRAAPGAQRGDGAPAFPSSGIPQPTHGGCPPRPQVPPRAAAQREDFSPPCSG